MFRSMVGGVLILAAAMPATAAQTRFRAVGIVDAPTGAALGVPLAAGDSFTATFTLSDGGAPLNIAPLGGQGQGRIYLQTLTALSITLGTGAGTRTVDLKPGKFGNGLVYNDGFSARSGSLIDYGGFVIPVEGSPHGLVPLLATDLVLPTNVFLANFSLGRVGPPGLLTSTALPDFRSFFGGPGATYFGLFSFRSGVAFNNAQFNALPLSEVSVQSLRVAVVPEPTTWALLIGGFGAVGAAARRRRAATPQAG